MDIQYHCRYDELVEPSDLVPHPKNSKMHPKEQIDALCRFIRVSGWRQPVTVSRRSGFVVAGHARLAAAIAIGCQAPVVTQDFDSETDEIAFLLADNRLAELAITDEDILQSNLDLLDVGGFDIGDIGFDLDIDLSIGETSSDGGAAEERQQSSQETGLDEIKVFVIPEKRVELMDLLKVFALKNGEKSIRWQKR